MLRLYFVLATLLSLARSNVHISVDDFLNSDIPLFPNQTIHHQHDFEDQTIERFHNLVDDHETLNAAYSAFKRQYGERRELPGNGNPHQSQTRRAQIFRESLVLVFTHNLQARMKKSSTFEMGANKFSDMTLEEFKDERLGLTIPDEDYNHNVPQPSFNLTRSRPTKFDWRDQGIVTSIKDQSTCGACVMFAMTSALETYAAIYKGEKNHDLAEQFILDCAVMQNGYPKNKGCEGNVYGDCLNFAVDHGITLEHLYPYKAKQGTCKFDVPRTIQPKSYSRLPDNSDDVKNSVVNNGPAAIGIYVYRGFMMYKSGVYEGCYPGTAVGGHAMAIMGYNDEDKQKYYVLKNQWGVEWGEKGFVRYTSTDSRCGMEKLAYTFNM